MLIYNERRYTMDGKLFKLNRKDLFAVFTGGFAVFAMFFGSGNLVFPLLAGKAAESFFLPSFLGLSLTGIFVPMMGLVGILLYNGNYHEFFQKYGKIVAFSLISFMLLILGPFGVLPRCVTVAFGSLSILSPEFSPTLFSLIMVGIVYLLCINQNQVVPLLGALLAPAKIGSVGFILVFGLLYAPTPEISTLSTLAVFEDGALKGYQMMDLIAGFFFASVIARHFKNRGRENDSSDRHTFALALYAILLGSLILFLIYFALSYLGATFAQSLNQHQPEQYLSAIAYLTLGKLGGKIVTIAIISSCLTTIVALTTVFTDFLHEHILNEKVHYAICLALTTIITFLMSNLGFSGISAFLSPILYYLYPLLICLTIINIAWWIKQKNREAKAKI